jgi:DNA-binding NarL/FixJ family response regulator
MASLPRILTVDPTGSVARLARAALDLLDRAVIQVDVPGDVEALDELADVRFRMVIAALMLSENFDGIALARRIADLQPNAKVIVIADDMTPPDFAPELSDDVSFVYLRRPIDAYQFLRVISAGLEGRDIRAAAYAAPADQGTNPPDPTFIPPIDRSAAQKILETVINDVGAMAAVFSNRAGEVLIETGASGLVDRQQLTAALLPTVGATVSMGHLVGGTSAALMVYDGTSYTVYVLSVGLHHFLSLIFNASNGSRVLGAVTRYGRRAAEDLIALIGAGALIHEPPKSADMAARKRTTGMLPALKLEPEALEPVAVKAEAWDETPAMEEPAVDSAPLFEPIPELDVSIFQQDVNALDMNALDDLFDPEKLAEIASETRRGHGPLTYDEARELGLIR